MKEAITSLQNPRIKQLVKLREKSAERQKQGLFTIEGLREITLALEAGIEFHAVFHCLELTSAGLSAGNAPRAGSPPSLLRKIPPGLLQEVSLPVFEKIAYRESSGGLLALASYRRPPLKDLRLSENPFLIILEAVEKPGNLGAVLRTADAAGADGVIVCDPRTDLYNPNVIRSSLGCVFTTQVATASSDDTFRFLEEQKIKIFAAALTATGHYHEADFSGPSAIVMGTESTGLTGKWLRRADAQIKIPMRGRIDSLNVSTSCAIIVFEAFRQRNFR